MKRISPWDIPERWAVWYAWRPVKAHNYKTRTTILVWRERILRRRVYLADRSLGWEYALPEWEGVLAD